jgi:preprotein translocase subunit YajC
MNPFLIFVFWFGFFHMACCFPEAREQTRLQNTLSSLWIWYSGMLFCLALLR